MSFVEEHHPVMKVRSKEPDRQKRSKHLGTKALFSLQEGVNLLHHLLTPLVLTAAFTIETGCVEVSSDLQQNLPHRHCETHTHIFLVHPSDLILKTMKLGPVDLEQKNRSWYKN